MMYHYTDSGLSNVYLTDGYDVLETEHGEAVSIHNLENLHKVIAHDLVQKSSALTGDEIRFLRKEMDLTQSSFADILSVSEDTVRGWENNRSDIPGPADKLIRVFYSKHSEGPNDLRQAVENIARIDREKAEVERRISFEENADGLWQIAA